MSAKQVTVGLQAVDKLFSELQAQAVPIAKHALYEGAKVLADELSTAVNKINTAPFHFVSEGGTPRLPSPAEKEVLTGGVGVAKFQGNGSEINTLVGIGGGYAEMKWEAYNPDTQKREPASKQVPVNLIANSIEHGTSFMQKQPFTRRAVAAAKSRVVERIGAVAEAKLNELINKGG